MNSKQRRKDQRRWKYSISLTITDYEQYVEIWYWCKANFTSKVLTCGWRDRHIDNWTDDSLLTIWQFTDKKKAVQFAIKWL